MDSVQVAFLGVVILAVVATVVVVVVVEIAAAVVRARLRVETDETDEE